MAITARLSRTLHVAFGEEGAADMMSWMQSVDDHRAELRELNEVTAGRIDTRMGHLETRMGQLETRMGRIETRIDRLESRIDQVETRLTADFRVGFKDLEAKIDRRFGDLIKWSFLFWCGAVATAALFR